MPSSEDWRQQVILLNVAAGSVLYSKRILIRLVVQLISSQSIFQLSSLSFPLSVEGTLRRQPNPELFGTRLTRTELIYPMLLNSISHCGYFD